MEEKRSYVPQKEWKSNGKEGGKEQEEGGEGKGGEERTSERRGNRMREKECESLR